LFSLHIEILPYVFLFFLNFHRFILFLAINTLLNYRFIYSFIAARWHFDIFRYHFEHVQQTNRTYTARQTRHSAVWHPTPHQPYRQLGHNTHKVWMSFDFMIIVFILLMYRTTCNSHSYTDNLDYDLHVILILILILIF
jgi:hypothetical protein